MRFYFAWVDPTDTTFLPAFAREDEDVFSLAINQKEGEFASMSLTIRNPRIGLLNPSRKRWGWLSVDLEEDGDVTPLFFGRLIGIPSNMFSELVTIEFTARPLNYETTKATFANTLKVLPYYDPIWLSPDAQLDPDVVLEARDALFHIDRVTHAITISNLLDGEDGLLEFLESEVPHDSVASTLDQAPARRVRVNANLGWTQVGAGTMNAVGRGANFNGFQYERLQTLTGDGMLENWPYPGTELGGGWRVYDSDIYEVPVLRRTFGVQPGWSLTSELPEEYDYTQIAPEGPSVLMVGVDYMKAWREPVNLNENDFWYATFSTFWYAITAIFWLFGFTVPVWTVDFALVLEYSASRKRFETISFTLESDIQDIVTMPGEDELIEISVSSQDVGQPVDYGSAVPIGDTRRRSYLETDRGRQSLEYLLCLARAQLVHRSRAVNVQFDCDFSRAVDLTCRKSALLHDRRFPGGQAAGKIIEYTLLLDGESGEAKGTVVLGCAIGRGTVVTPQEGDAIYIDDDYIENEMYVRENELNLLGAGDVAYSIPVAGVVDDGLDLMRPLEGQSGVISKQILFTMEEQKEAITTAIEPVVFDMYSFNLYRYNIFNIPTNIEWVDPKERNELQIDIIKNLMPQIATQYQITLHDMNGGPYTADYAINTSLLVIPKMIDLEAASNA